MAFSLCRYIRINRVLSDFHVTLREWRTTNYYRDDLTVRRRTALNVSEETFRIPSRGDVRSAYCRRRHSSLPSRRRPRYFYTSFVHALPPRPPIPSGTPWLDDPTSSTTPRRPVINTYHNSSVLNSNPTVGLRRSVWRSFVHTVTVAAPPPPSTVLPTVVRTHRYCSVYFTFIPRSLSSAHFVRFGLNFPPIGYRAHTQPC